MRGDVSLDGQKPLCQRNQCQPISQSGLDTRCRSGGELTTIRQTLLLLGSNDRSISRVFASSAPVRPSSARSLAASLTRHDGRYPSVVSIALLAFFRGSSGIDCSTGGEARSGLGDGSYVVLARRSLPATRRLRPDASRSLTGTAPSTLSDRMSEPGLAISSLIGARETTPCRR